MKKKILMLVLSLLLIAGVASAEIIYTLTWVNSTGTATEATTCTYKHGENGSNNACNSDGTQRVAINTVLAKDISYHCDSATDTNHTATDWDINFLIAPSATGQYTDVTNRYYGKDGLLEDAVFSGELTPPKIKWMKLTLDENGALRADVVCTIIIYGAYE